MNYEIYKNVRNASWQCLIDCNITDLPLKLSAICKHFNIKIVHNSSLNTSQLDDNERGKTVYFNSNPTIIVSDAESVQVQRYTIAHELGHILIGENISEYEAERFAIGILAPSCVLWGLNIHDPEEIASLCNISIRAAQIRAERMEILYKREQEFLKSKRHSCFLLSKLEQQVYSQFKPFINEIKTERNGDRNQFPSP